MCQSKSFDKICTWWFAIWNIILGLIWSFLGYLAIIGHEHGIRSRYYDTVVCLFTISICICAPLHVLSGILIMLGDWKDSKRMFTFGKNLSNLFPFFLLGTIIFPIIHFAALTRVCRYYEKRWKSMPFSDSN
ncbi:uncharacterized protein LOC117582171 [Drosophila guanche]|uniref:uncharacterized protein LOC117582171 n=1 Tax=Drosophila guanche TaxID=7266 RepID=UPI001471A722|nr:uncharacterized protein LOC117582171 [Drosophila guanche]